MGKKVTECVCDSAVQRVRPGWVAWIWIFAVVAQLGQSSLYHTFSGPDRNRQLLAASSWLAGHGLSEPYLESSTGDVHFEPLVSWAPGYSLLAGVFFTLVGDWLLTAEAISWLAVLLVFVGLRMLMLRLRSWLNWQSEVFLLLFWAISFTPFRYFTDTDTLALGAALIASAWMMDRTWSGYLLATFMLLVAAWFRIAYVPLILISALLSWWNGASLLPNRETLVAGVAGVVVMVAYWWLLKPSHPVSGGVGDTLVSGGRYPQHWLSWDAFPVKAWLYVSAEGITNRWGEPFGLVAHLALLTGSGIVIGIFSSSVWSVTSSSENVRERYIMLTVIVGGMICLMLGWLSLRTPMEIHDEIRTWTYVQETRYYAWIIIMLAVWMVGWSQQRSWARYAALFLLLAGWGHGLYRHGSAIGSNAHAATRWSEPEQQLREFVDHVNTLSASGPVWIIPGESIYLRDKATLGCLAGGVVVLTADMLPESGTVLDLRQ